ncbi:MAG: DUF642 domain-containing protein, partial [Silicimonas sp.]|nr:DUF642 domain-containing protein [Silicimonas sp.]
GAGEDEIYALLPNPLINQTDPFQPDRDVPSVALGQPISTTNAGKALNPYPGLLRSYKFAVTFGADPDGGGGGTPAPALVVNGSFEKPSVANWELLDSIPGWDVITGPAEIDNAIWAASDGSQSMDLNGNAPAVVAQTITGLTPGATYALSFDYSINPTAQANATADVSINGTVVLSVTGTTDMKPPAYQQASVEFIVPASGQATIGFSGTSSGSAGAVIDNVEMTGIGGGGPVEPPVEPPSGGVPADIPVVNGSFEAPVVANWGAFDSIPGWTTTSGPLELDGAIWPAAEGSQSMDLNGNGPVGLEQVVTGLTPGATYALTYQYGVHTGATSSKTAIVFVNGNIAENITATTAMKPPNYTSGRYEFTAPASGQVTIGFAGSSTGSTGAVIDNVEISPAP